MNRTPSPPGTHVMLVGLALGWLILPCHCCAGPHRHAQLRLCCPGGAPAEASCAVAERSPVGPFKYGNPGG